MPKTTLKTIEAELNCKHIHQLWKISGHRQIVTETVTDPFANAPENHLKIPWNNTQNTTPNTFMFIGIPQSLNTTHSSKYIANGSGRQTQTLAKFSQCIMRF